MGYYRCFAFAAWAVLFYEASPARAAPYSACRCLPEDPCWPSTDDWAKLNNTVGGRLITTVPLAAVCHSPNYDAEKCSALRASWEDPLIHSTSPSSIMTPYFHNQSCDPFTPESSQCTLGNYVNYSINVTSAEDVGAGIRFAQKNNIRLVIKNTGHDYLGKSTGKGALGLWMHNLKSIEFLDYKSQSYSGPAVKMAAGVQAFEAYTAAAARGFRVVGGVCPTVGLSGGYTQGGGTGTLSSTYGLGADQALEWEVVTADGKLVTASPVKNPDLYWALSGGGGGTYGVIVSLTAKAHPDGNVGGGRLIISSTGLLGDKFWDAVTFWHTTLPAMVDAGAEVGEYITNDTFILTATAPGQSEADVAALFKPFTDELHNSNITYSLNVTSDPNYFDHFNSYYGPLPRGQFAVPADTGGRLIPRSTIQSNNSALTSAIREICKSGKYAWAGVDLNVSHKVAGNTPASNAVHPAWRETIICGVIIHPWGATEPWEEKLAEQNEMTTQFDPMLRALAPDSGTYLNEGDFRVQTWKQDFYGSNYDRLRAIKKKYDPDDLFYATTAVGSDAWTAQSDGRLCRA